MSMNILAINPGSTSTKISVYNREEKVLEKTIRHSSEELKRFSHVIEQYEWREALVLECLKENNFDIKTLKAVVGRGGLIRPIESGTYRIDKEMLDFLREARGGEHASNLGAFIAKEIADSLNIESFIVDPVVVDEFDDIARISGLKEINRRSLFHALNQKAVSKRYAQSIKKKYEDLNLIVVHLGGGISVAAHKNGRVIDTTNGLDGEGTFTPERTGGLPAIDLAKMCFSGKYTFNDIKKMIAGKGGMVSYFGHNDMFEICKKAEDGDKEHALIVDAMCYQTAKDIGSMATVLEGKIDAIIITGGLARDKFVVGLITKRINFLGRLEVIAGEEEMLALTLGVVEAMDNPSIIKDY